MVILEFEKEVGITKRRKERFIRCQCSIDGYEWESKLSNLLQGKGCSKCAKNIRLDVNIIKETIKTINSNIDILSKEYINNREKLECKCKIDGYEWKASWSNLQEGKGCPKCAIKKVHDNQRLEFDYIKDKLKIIRPNYEFVSKEYINAQTKLKIHCLIHNHVWETTWTHLCEGKGCPCCAKDNNSGRNHWNWKGGLTMLREYLREHILQWKYDSASAFNGKCDISGTRKDLVIHHVNKNFSDILQETMNSLNLPIYQEINQYTDDELKLIGDKCVELHYKYGLGVCLTNEIHKEFHKIYGKSNNTKEQYIEFKNNKLHKQELVQAN